MCIYVCSMCGTFCSSRRTVLIRYNHSIVYRGRSSRVGSGCASESERERESELALWRICVKSDFSYILTIKLIEKKFASECAVQDRYLRAFDDINLMEYHCMYGIYLWSIRRLRRRRQRRQRTSNVCILEMLALRLCGGRACVRACVRASDVRLAERRRNFSRTRWLHNSSKCEIEKSQKC